MRESDITQPVMEEGMKVWIVLQRIGYEETSIDGVFIKSFEAHQHMKKKKREKEYFTDYYIEQWEVN